MSNKGRKEEKRNVEVSLAAALCKFVTTVHQRCVYSCHCQSVRENDVCKRVCCLKIKLHNKHLANITHFTSLYLHRRTTVTSQSVNTF